MKKIVVSTILLSALICQSQLVYAQKTYTPAQLKSMIQSGKYPAQGDVQTQTVSRSYSECIATMDEILGAVRPYYPVQTIASSRDIRVEKAWTNDGAVTVSCSAPDRKMVLTRSSYR